MRIMSLYDLIHINFKKLLIRKYYYKNNYLFLKPSHQIKVIPMGWGKEYLPTVPGGTETLF